MADNYADVAQRFEEWMTTFGLNGSIIERETGIRQSNVSDWRNGKSVPSGQLLIKLHDFYKLPIGYILTGEEIDNDEMNIIKKYRMLDAGNKKRLAIELARLYDLQNIDE